MRVPIPLLFLAGIALASPPGGGGGSEEDGPVVLDRPPGFQFKDSLDVIEHHGTTQGWSPSRESSDESPITGATAGTREGVVDTSSSPATEHATSQANTKAYQFTGFVDDAIKKFSPVDDAGKPVWKAEPKPTQNPLPAKDLRPVAFDGSSEDVLNPKKTVGFWYKEADDAAPRSKEDGVVYDAHVRFDMKADTVPLSFTDKVTLRCALVEPHSFNLDVAFKNNEEVAAAAKAWDLGSRKATNPLYFAAIFPSGCKPSITGNSRGDAITFAKYLGVSNHGLSLNLTLHHISYDYAIDEMEAYIGAAPPEVAADVLGRKMDEELDKESKMTTEDAILGATPKRRMRRDGTRRHIKLKQKIKLKFEKLKEKIKEKLRRVKKQIKKIFRQRQVTIREEPVVIDWEPSRNQISKVFPGRKEWALPQIVDQLRVSCVECYAKARQRYAGRIVWQPGRRHDASFWIQGGLEIQAQLGLVTTGILELSHEIPLLEVPLQPYNIPGLVHVGPMFTIAFEIGVEVDGEMKLITGANVKWDDMSTTVNLHRAPKHIVGYGWKPKFTPLFSIDGNFEVDAFAGLSANLKFGVSLASGGISFDVRAADRVTARAGFSVEGREFRYDNKDKKWTFKKPEGDASGIVMGSKKCEGGLEMHTGFRNEVLVIAFHWWRKTLHRLNFRPRHTCIKFGHDARNARANAIQLTSVPDDSDSDPSFSEVVITDHRNPTNALGYNGAQNVGLLPLASASENAFSNDGVTVLDTDAYDRDGNSAAGAYLVGFKNEIDTYGVSRLRTARGPDIPDTAFFVSLTSGDGEEDDDTPALVAVTTRDDSDDVLMVINCFYADGRTRAFLARELEEASGFLVRPRKEDERASARVRGGGVVEECFVLGWKISPLEVAAGEDVVDEMTWF